MFGNGAIDLTHPDEVFYIETAKEMLNAKDLLTPRIFEAPQFEKPIFAYWLFMLSLKILGFTPFAARLAPALCGLFAVFLIYGISWVMFKNKRLAFLSGWVLMSSVMHLALSRAVLTDMIFTLWVTCSLGAFYWAYSDPSAKKKGLILSGAASGLAVLTKGLLGFCFPMGTILIFLLWRKDLKFLKSWATLIGLALLLVIALPWHIYMYQLYGREFIEEYFKNVHVRRLFVAEHERLNKWYFYPLVMAGGLFPWTIFIFSAGKLFFGQLREKASQPFVFLASWILGVLVFIQPAYSKLASYIAPAFPALTFIVAYYVEQILAKSKKEQDRSFEVPVYGLIIFLVVFAAAIIFVSEKYRNFIPSFHIVWIGATLFLGTAVFIFLNMRKKERGSVILSIPLVFVALLASCGLAIPVAEPWVTCKQISGLLQKVDQGDSTVLVSKFFVRGVKYYTGRKVAVLNVRGEPFYSHHPIPFLDTDTKVDLFLRTQPVTYCIVRHAGLDDLQRIAINGEFRITELGESGGKFLLKIEKIKKQKISSRRKAFCYTTS